MEKIELNVEVRSEMGKGNARKMRALKKVPGIFYGPHQKEPLAFAVSEIEIRKVLKKGGNLFLNLKTEGSSPLNGKVAMVKDEQLHPLTGAIEHVDFYEIRMDEEMKVKVPVILTGKAKGTVEGGILQQITRELEIRCLPNSIPEKITVDVSSLDVGFSIHVKEVTLPAGVKVVGQVNYTIAAVVAPQEEKVVEPAPGTVVAGAAPVAGAPAVPGAAPAAGAKPAPGAAPAVAGAKPAPGAAPAAGGKAPAAGGKAPGKESGKK